MPSVIITISDADDGKSIKCDCSLDLYPGKPMSLAQIAAAEIMRRTNGAWSIKAAVPAKVQRPVTTNSGV